VRSLIPESLASPFSRLPSMLSPSHFYGGVWTYWTPIEGIRLWLNDEDTEYAFDGTAWVVYPIVGRLSKSVAGGSDVTLTAAEARNQILEFTGTLTANINVVMPAVPSECLAPAPTPPTGCGSARNGSQIRVVRVCFAELCYAPMSTGGQSCIR
jgi:hypothetical protein